MSIQTPFTTLQNLFFRHRGKLFLTYTLTLLENIFELLYPLVIGIAINGLLSGDYAQLLPLTVTWVVHTITEVMRQMYDTRTFSGIYSKLATKVVAEQAKQGIPTSQVIARSSLSREIVDFFERDIPLTLTAALSFFGAVGMLFWYDLQIGLYCLFLLIPVVFINRYFGKLSLRLNQKLNDQLEQEVDILTEREPYNVKSHYQLLNRWRIKLSDAEAKNWGITTLLLGGLIIAVLMRAIALPNIAAGDIYTIVTYAMNFTLSMDDVPFLVQQLSRLKDISYRVDLPLSNV